MSLSVTTSFAFANSATQVVVTKPSSVLADDTLLIIATAEPSPTPNFASCAGFTQNLTSSKDTNRQSAISMLYRIADASDVAATNYTVTLPGAATSGAVAMFRIRGTGSGNPLTASAVVQDQQDLSSWTISSGTISLARASEQLLIIAGQFNGESNAATFSSYTVTSTDANPTWTEVCDGTYTVNAGPADNAFFVAYAITSHTSTITGYSVSVSGATTGTADSCSTFLAVIAEPINATPDIEHLAVSPALFDIDVTQLTQTATVEHLNLPPTLYDLAARAISNTNTEWENEDKPSDSDWENQNK